MVNLSNILVMKKGNSETGDRFEAYDTSVYRNEKFNNSISSETLKNHQLRTEKYKNKENFKVTGETETSVRFIPHKPDDYENVRAKRDESKSNNNIFPQTKFEGNSEYTVIYSRLNECLPKPESPFTINPYKNIDCASRGRPNEPNNMMTQESLRNAYTTHTMVSHQWPYPEDRRRFDWMQNKLI